MVLADWITASDRLMSNVVRLAIPLDKLQVWNILWIKVEWPLGIFFEWPHRWLDWQWPKANWWCNWQYGSWDSDNHHPTEKKSTTRGQNRVGQFLKVSHRVEFFILIPKRPSFCSETNAHLAQLPDSNPVFWPFLALDHSIRQATWNYKWNTYPQLLSENCSV